MFPPRPRRCRTGSEAMASTGHVGLLTAFARAAAIGPASGHHHSRCSRRCVPHRRVRLHAHRRHGVDVHSSLDVGMRSCFVSRTANGFFMNWYASRPARRFEYHLLAIAPARVRSSLGGGAVSRVAQTLTTRPVDDARRRWRAPRLETVDSLGGEAGNPGRPGIPCSDFNAACWSCSAVIDALQLERDVDVEALAADVRRAVDRVRHGPLRAARSTRGRRRPSTSRSSGRR